MYGNKDMKLSPKLRQYKLLFDLLKHTTSDYLFLMDIKADIFVISPNFGKTFELAAEYVSGIEAVLLPLVHRQEQTIVRDLFAHIIADKTNTRKAEFRLMTRKGDYMWLRLTGRVSLDEHGKPNMLVGTISPLGRQNQADAVTGLLNRYQFIDDLSRELERARLTGSEGGVIVFGIDNFRTVNEVFNHNVGDVVLRQTAERFLENIPQGLSLYRLDGDEFGVIYPEADAEMLETLYIRIQREFSAPRIYGDKQYLITISAGVVFYPQAAKDPLILHRYAKAALGTAKSGGKNRINYFSKEIYNRWLRSLSIQEEILQDVKAGCRNFELYFQPQVAGDDQRIIGAETLLRWKNAKGYMVAPMEFINILEETKTIIPVGRWVIEESIKICKRWRTIMPDFKMSINVSYEQLKDLSFRDFVEDCLSRHDMPPESIVLELTENRIVGDIRFINKQLDAFRQRGIKIAMDDFGTGYSSLSMLKNLACDIVKIDRAFVAKILDNHFDKKLVEYTVDLCHSIGITTCVEGVEKQAEYNLLRSLCKVDAIQGYLFGRPEPEKIFEEKFLSRAS